MQVQPPKNALRFLRWFCRRDYLEEIEGDLIEIFESHAIDNPQSARRKFWWQVLLHFRPDFIRSFHSNSVINSAMFFHYLKVAWRNLSRHRLYSFINLSGLTVGMTCFLLVAFFIQYQLSYDRHFPDNDRIYRVIQQQEGNAFRGSDLFAVTPRPLASAVREQIPEVESAVRLGMQQDLLYGNEIFFPVELLYTESGFVDFFSLEVLSGEGRSSLKDPSTILLSKSLAEKHFGKQDPIGKTLLLNDRKELVVRGIYEDFPNNQHFQAEGILSIENLPNWEGEQGKWASNSYYSYVKLKDGVEPSRVEESFRVFDENVEAAYSQFPFSARYMLQPIASIHLNSGVNVENQARSDVRYVYLMAAVAILILLIAGINYMNLATVRSARRSTEMGVRKVMGAVRWQLVSQVLGEALLLTIFSFITSVILVKFLLPYFGYFLDMDVPFQIAGNVWTFIGMIFLAILIGGLSGLYPAWFISAVNPVKAFSGTFMGKPGSQFSLQNLLIVGQFATTVVLAVCAVVMYQQMKYIQNKKLGFNKDQILYVSYFGRELGQNTDRIRNELLKNSNINEVSVSTNLIVETYNQGIVDSWEGNSGERDLYCYRYHVDEYFLDLFDIPLKAGRNFSLSHSTDSTQSYLLNETAAKAIGWTAESAIGKNFAEGKVIGVVEDFHFQPMDLKIEPLYIRYRHPENQSTDFGYVSMKVNTNHLESTLPYILATFKDEAPRKIFEYRFLDETFENMYLSEKRMGQAFSVFTLIALFIASIGLFGMISYQIVQRTKELSIRKVLGATTIGLMSWLSRDFLRLISISVLIAIPFSILIVSRWLDHFAYHTPVHWWVYLIVSVPVILIAGLTVGLQSFKAARSNPANALKE